MSTEYAIVSPRYCKVSLHDDPRVRKMQKPCPGTDAHKYWMSKRQIAAERAPVYFIKIALLPMTALYKADLQQPRSDLALRGHTS